MKEAEYRQKLIDAIIGEEVEFDRNHDGDDYANILEHGFEGYKNMTTEYLEDQFKLRHEGHPDFDEFITEEGGVSIKNKDFTSKL